MASKYTSLSTINPACELCYRYRTRSGFTPLKLKPTSNYDRKLGVETKYLIWKRNPNTLIVRAHVLRPRKPKSNILRVQESRCDIQIHSAMASYWRISVRRSSNTKEERICYRYRTRACFLRAANIARRSSTRIWLYGRLRLHSALSTSPHLSNAFMFLRRRKQEPTSKLRGN